MKTSKLSLIIALVLPLFLIGCEKEAPGPDSFNGVLKFALLYDYDFSEAVTVYGPLKVERAKSKPVALINEIQLSDYDC